MKKNKILSALAILSIFSFTTFGLAACDNKSDTKTEEETTAEITRYIRDSSKALNYLTSLANDNGVEITFSYTIDGDEAVVKTLQAKGNIIKYGDSGYDLNAGLYYIKDKEGNWVSKEITGVSADVTFEQRLEYAFKYSMGVYAVYDTIYNGIYDSTKTETIANIAATTYVSEATLEGYGTTTYTYSFDANDVLLKYTVKGDVVGTSTYEVTSIKASTDDIKFE